MATDLKRFTDMYCYVRATKKSDETKVFSLLLFVTIQEVAQYVSFSRKLQPKWNIHVNFSPFRSFCGNCDASVWINKRMGDGPNWWLVDKWACCETFVFVVRNNTTTILSARYSCRHSDGAPLFHFSLRDSLACTFRRSLLEIRNDVFG